MKFIDMHCDTISSIYLDRMGGEVKKLRENNGHVDLARLKKGGCLAQNFALFTILKKDPDPCGFARGACRLSQLRRFSGMTATEECQACLRSKRAESATAVRTCFGIFTAKASE